MNNTNCRPLGIAASRKKRICIAQTDATLTSISSEKAISQVTPTILLGASPEDDDITQVEALYKSASEQTDICLSAALLRGTLHECDQLIQENKNQQLNSNKNEIHHQEGNPKNTITERYLRVYIIYAMALLDLARLTSEGMDVQVNGAIESDTDTKKNIEDLKDDVFTDGIKLADNLEIENNNISNDVNKKKENSIKTRSSSISTTLMLIDAAIDRCNAGLALNLNGSNLPINHNADLLTLQHLRGRAKLTKLMHQAYRPYDSIKNILKNAMDDLDVLNSTNMYCNITYLLHWIATVGDDCQDILEKKAINDWVASKWHLLLKENESDAEALEGLGFIELSMSNAYLEPMEEMDEIDETTEAAIQAEAHMNNAISYFMKAYNIQEEKGVPTNLLIMIVEAKISLANLKDENERSEGYKDALKYLKKIDPRQSHRLPNHLWDILNELDAS
ncbi:unnamed protein product [Pneumocystis jirovecii]|uniref:Enhancer of translation termination 1 n=1 Tax=Pneumocystis jirovecii TaxID=42068 RepID=L0PAG7_PNEJI|nr:unnamed protein product [Pneumocystis jirovecii]